MFFCVFKICRKYRIVNFGSKNAFLCKFLYAKEVCPPKWTDLLKGFDYWEGNMSSTGISLSAFYLPSAMQILSFDEL